MKRGFRTECKIFLTVFSFCAFLLFPFRSSFALDNQNWLADVIDEAKISWLTIPGTHDTATFNVDASLSVIEKGGTCQSMNIEQQLDAGIRAFDLRYKWENGKFYLYHGEDSYACKCKDSNGTHLDLAAVLQKCRAFLDAHPSEFIIVNIQKESGDYNSTELSKVKSAYGLVNLYDSTIVGSVRGKIVNGSSFMQGVEYIPYNRWEGSVDEKVSDLKTVFTNAPSIYKYYPSTIYLQCVCTNLSWRKGKPLTWPKDYAEDVREKFFSTNQFGNYGQKAYGVILYDFPTETLINWTIGANNWAKPITCTVKFNSQGGSAVSDQIVKECKLLTQPSEPLRDSYAFVGWYKDESCTQLWDFTTDRVRNAATTLYAKWSATAYKITYAGIDSDTYNPNKLKTVYSPESETYILQDPVKKGWKFLGWYDKKGTKVTQIIKGTTGDLTLTATWALETYDVSFKNVDGAVNPNEVKTYTINSGKITLSDATKDNYIFDGWYTQDGTESGNWGKQVTEIAGGATGDVDLYAKWTPVTYSIKYENATADENPNKTSEYTVETPTIQLKDAEREGYEFLGWFDAGGNKVTEIATGSFGDVVLTAKWKLCEHKITYSNLCGAENPNKVTKFSIESGTIVLKNPERAGYYFDGWYTSKGFVVTEITKETKEDVALTARWTAISYTITYSNADDVENPNSNLTYTIETPTIKLKNCEKEGYVFDGWFEKFGVATEDWGKQITEIKKGSTGNITLYAKWTQTVSMMRLYNPYTGEHFYTSDTIEFDNLVALGWKDEGIGWVAPETSNTPVYRLYNPNSGDHHYTTSADERDSLTKVGWRDEEIGWYSDDNKGVALYRQYNPNATVGTHNYTTSKDENDKLVKAGWRSEGISWYGLK